MLVSHHFINNSFYGKTNILINFFCKVLAQFSFECIV